MLNKNSCVLGTNLAIMLKESGRMLSPVNGTLMNELVNASFSPCLVLNQSDNMEENLPDFIATSSNGSFVTNGQKEYSASKHDALMDNYIATISTLVASHVQYARSVVYPRVKNLAETLELAMQAGKVTQPEDFFIVNTYSLPEVFNSSFVENEVIDSTFGNTSLQVINLGDAVTLEFDLLAYVTDIESDTDILISDWFKSVGVDKLKGYLTSANNGLAIAAMEPRDLINYSFINFLFYRALAIKQDMGKDLSVTKLINLSAGNRDHFAQTLKEVIYNLQSQLRDGVILSSGSNTNFSYLGDNKFEITIYSLTFDKAVENGASIEQVFGFIAKHRDTRLTMDMLANNGADYSATWNAVRGMYMAHVTANQDSVLKLAVKLESANCLYYEMSEEEQLFYTENLGFKEKTASLITEYADMLTPLSADSVIDVAVDVVAGIGFRHSSAGFIIREMLLAMKKDKSLEAGEAAMIATAAYIIDYLVDEIDVVV